MHALVHSRLDYCNSVLGRLSWSLVQQLQSVLNSVARLIFGLKRFNHITPALIDLHWLPYQQRITYKLCMIMFKCLRGSAPAYLADYCTSTSLVSGRSALRSAAHGDIVVPCHRTDLGLRSFALAGPSRWNALPVGLRSSFVGLDTFAKHLKNTSIWFSVGSDTVAVSPNKIIFIFFSFTSNPSSRGHSFRIRIPLVKTNIHKQYLFSCRVVNCWNSLTATS